MPDVVDEVGIVRGQKVDSIDSAEVVRRAWRPCTTSNCAGPF